MEPPSAPRQRAAVDRLSDLPDGILMDVVSRLTFRQAARTGVLSRRFKSLWHAVPYPPSCIDIDHLAFRCKDDGPVPRSLYIEAEKLQRRDDDEAQEEGFAFMDFGDRVTSGDFSPPPPLGAFRLRVADRNGFYDAHRWIRRALTRRPMAVTIRCNDGEDPDYWPMRPLFSFDKYSRGGGAFTCHLRALLLYGVTLQEEFAGVIAGELPVLEDLRLEDCDYSFSRISSTSLQNLSIYNCDGDMVALAVPCLAILHIDGDRPLPVTVEHEMPSLLVASLEHPTGDAGLFGSLRNVRNLSLYGFSTNAFLLDDGDEHGGGFPAFRDLRNLYLDECDIGVECQLLD
ncbi:unnamed protein product [Urochloa humidicola]